MSVFDSCCWLRLNFRETGEMFIEVCPDNKRDKITLEMLITKRVKLGTHIITDGWAAYKGLERLGWFKF